MTRLDHPKGDLVGLHFAKRQEEDPLWCLRQEAKKMMNGAGPTEVMSVKVTICGLKMQ